MYNILIEPVLNGFVCRVGCQTVVFQSRADMCSTLADYYADPVKVEKQFRESACNRDLLKIPQAPVPANPYTLPVREPDVVACAGNASPTDTCNQTAPITR